MVGQCEQTKRALPQRAGNHAGVVLSAQDAWYRTQTVRACGKNDASMLTLEAHGALHAGREVDAALIHWFAACHVVDRGLGPLGR